VYAGMSPYVRASAGCSTRRKTREVDLLRDQLEAYTASVRAKVEQPVPRDETAVRIHQGSLPRLAENARRLTTMSPLFNLGQRQASGLSSCLPEAGSATLAGKKRKTGPRSKDVHVVDGRTRDDQFSAPEGVVVMGACRGPGAINGPEPPGCGDRSSARRWPVRAADSRR